MEVQAYIKNGHPVKVIYRTPVDFAFRANVEDVTLPGARTATDQPQHAPNIIRIPQGISTGMLAHKVLRFTPMRPGGGEFRAWSRFRP